MSTPNYKLIPLSEIDKEAREIAVAWVEQYGTMGFDIENKHKLASDIMNYHLNKMKKYNRAVELLRHFVDKVETGRAKSFETYNLYKDFLNEIKDDDVQNPIT